MQGEKLRIAMVGTKGVPAKWGGIERYIEEIGKRLTERGHEITVFGSRWFLKDFHKDTYHGMLVRRIPTLHFQSTDALSNAALSTLLIAMKDYDVVHFHNFASYFCVPTIKMFGKKTVVTSHGIGSGWNNPKYGSFARTVLKAGFMVGITNADAVTVVAEHLKNELKSVYNIDSQVLPSGIDEVTTRAPDIIRRRYELQGGDYILFLGRIDPIKRIEWLLDLKGIIDNHLRIVIAGGTQNSAMESYLRNLILSNGENRQVLFTGPVGGILKSELLSNCRLFFSPSQYEGLPITVIEAVSYGRCCVVSDIPAHAEIISHGKTGFLFPRDDRAAFTALAKEMSSLPKERLDAMGASAGGEIRSKFDWGKTARELEAVYRKLTHEK